MTKITLRPGDYVATADIKDDAEYHAIARAFIKAGASEDEYEDDPSDPIPMGWMFFGWGNTFGLEFWDRGKMYGSSRRQLTPAQILGTDDGKWVPEVGNVVEAFADGEWCRAEWFKQHNERHAVFFIKSRALGWAEDVRPLPTEEDRAIEEMANMAIPGQGCIGTVAAKALFDAGYRKQPPQPAEDMDDPANWRSGDIVEYAELYEIIENKDGDVIRYIDSDGAKKRIDADKLRFHSRP